MEIQSKLNPHFPFSISQPLIVITGPTASGKTSLAIKLAKQFGGEIICADSRTIYKGMDIGTAKPTRDEQAEVLYWGLDLVVPGERFTAADFKQYAVGKIAQIRARGNIPFLVGGTGLYIDSVVLDFNFGSELDPEFRQFLSDLSLEELYEYCDKNNIKLPENDKNKRYVMRAIEQNGHANTSKHKLDDTVVVAIATDKDVLRARIAERTEQLFSSNVVEEATAIAEEYGWENEAMTGNIYQIIHEMVHNGLSPSEAKAKNTTIDWRLAKRQLTWLRRHNYVHWLILDEAYDYIANILCTL